MKPWERYAPAPQPDPAAPAAPPAAGPWTRYGAPAGPAAPQPSGGRMVLEINGVSDQQPPEHAGAIASLAGGAVRGLRDLVDTGAYLVPKGLEFATSAYGLAPNAVSQFFADQAHQVSDLNKQAEQDFEQRYGGGWGTAGRIGGNIATAFIPGTGQTQLANTAQRLWQAGGALNKLRSLGTAAGLGAGQAVSLGTKTEDDSAILNALVGGAGGAVGQGLVGGATDAINAIRRMRAGVPYRAGERLTRAAVDPDQAIANLTNAPELVPGAAPMAHQAADDVGIARLGKTVRNYSPTIPTREIEQDAARRAALESISPITATPIESATNAGNLIAGHAGENRQILKDAIRGAYNVPELQGMYLTPPSDEVGQVLRQFYPGRIPSGTPNEVAVRNLVANLSDGIPMGFPELQKFRKLASDQAFALANTDPTASAAYGAIRDILDSLPDRAIEAGNLMPESAQAFDAAKFLRRTLGERFDTGPARDIFRRGADQLPARQGAEVARGFFNSGATQGTDIDALQRLVPGDDAALQAMRNYAISDLDAFATKGQSGEFSASKFNGWLRGRAEALPGLFEPGQVETMGNIGADLSRAERAIAMASAKGGSDTEMNRILSNTAIDSPILTGIIDQVVRRVPLVGNTTANLLRGAQTGLSESARKRAAEELAQIMLDPTAAASAMSAFRGAQARMVAPPAALPLTLTPALSGLLAQ